MTINLYKKVHTHLLIKKNSFTYNILNNFHKIHILKKKRLIDFNGMSTCLDYFMPSD